MKNIVVSAVLLLAGSPVVGQGVPPVVRYNAIAESIYVLERCGMMTSERKAWTANVRENAMRANGWDAAQAAAQDEKLKPEFAQRHAVVAKEKCEQLARGTDLERRGTTIAR